VLTKNFTVFIKFCRFNSFFDDAFTVMSRSKTIAALRLCVLDGNGSLQRRMKQRGMCKFKKIYTGVLELRSHRTQACTDSKRDSKITKINVPVAHITEL
jgi:hypothetical protein